MRARRELRAQQRAVTAEDYENLAKKSSRSVARAKCRTPGVSGDALPPGTVEILIVPAAFDGLASNDMASLAVGPALREEVAAFLDRYRLLTTVLSVRAPRYLGVSVTAEIVVAEYSHPETVRMRVLERVREFISPLKLSESPAFDPEWEGWPFGRDLYVSELFSLIQQVPGVQHVLDVHIAARELSPLEESVANGPETANPPPLTAIQGRVLPVPEDTLLCSLMHQVKVVEL